MKLKSVSTFLGLICLSAGLSAQTTSVSSYSAFGVGSLQFDSNIEQAGMGGLTVLSTNPYYASGNFFNPATNKNLRVTSFEFGTTTNMSQFDDGQDKSKKSTTYISSMSLAFPVGPKASAGFGFQPYSSIGYELATLTENEDVRYVKSFDGNGGINSFHVMGSYTVTPEISVGIRANYLFGDIERTQTILTEGLALNTDYKYNADLSGFQFTAGGYYTKTLADKKKLDVGLTYSLGSNINATINDVTTTYNLINMVPGNIDTVHYKKTYGDMKLPQTIAIGASLRKDLHWMVGAQLDWGDWGNYAMNGEKSPFYDTRVRASVGGFWIPNFNSYKSYFDRVTYRAGGYFEQTPLRIGDTTINKYGLTLGLGLPIGKDRDASMLNLSLEMGSMGSAKNSAIKENFANLKVGFTLNDVWFRKRIID